MKDTPQHQGICPLFLNSSVFVLFCPLWYDKEAKDEGGQANGFFVRGFSLRILVAGEKCNFTGEYFKRGSVSE